MKRFFVFLIAIALSSCASMEKKGFDDGLLVMNIQTYELLILENYELLDLMDEEGDAGPSRHRNLIEARLNSALYALGMEIGRLEEKTAWSQTVHDYVNQEGYRAQNRAFMKRLREKWERAWKDSFKDTEGYRDLAFDRYIKYGNAFGLEE